MPQVRGCEGPDAPSRIRTCGLLLRRERQRLRRLTTDDDESRFQTRVSTPPIGPYGLSMRSGFGDVWVTTGSRGGAIE